MSPPLHFRHWNHTGLRTTMQFRLIVTALMILSVHGTQTALAQHEHAERPADSPPKIFLDKSPRIVEYQLNRLSNEQLLMVERDSTDAKFLPVFQAILTREGISRAYRDEALDGLVKLNQSDAVVELISALQSQASPAERMINSLAGMLLEQSPASLAKHGQLLLELAARDNAQIASVGYAALILAQQLEPAWQQATQGQRLPSLLNGIAIIPDPQIRGNLHPRVLALTDSQYATDTRQAALYALAKVPQNWEQTFSRAAELIRAAELRDAAVTALLAVPQEHRDAKTSLALIDWLVVFAEETPAAERTQNTFQDAMQLVDQLIAGSPSDVAKRYRERLRETVVRVVRIHTVEEEMRYDLPFFAVEAGRPVQVVLINEDIMPHNLVVTTNGALQEVAELGLAVGPTGGLDGKQYVPDSDKVLFATDMVAAGAREALTFTAPEEVGEYPYVCTFPRHWMRMYGVMVVVEDLDAWLKNPVTPVDPIGSNRHFVQSWTVDDFRADMQTGMRGRSPQIGEKLFVEATCAQCHKAGTAGVGQVGPDLAQVFSRWKGDGAAVLQEILDPSHRIDDKYAVHVVLTVDGLTVSGLVVEDTKDHIAIMENPEAKEPTVIPRDDIERVVKTSNSMMPKGLLDRYSKDEVFEILAFILSVQQ